MVDEKDYFSAQATQYALFRPRYPQSLFDYLLEDVNDSDLIVDCATGNGQAAQQLAVYQHNVLATDLSLAQLAKAPRANNIYFLCATAEALPVKDNSVALLTIAQALHWFQFDEFYDEVKRVLTPHGKIAAWTYSLLAICDQLDHAIAEAIRWFYHDIVGPYWPPERRWVDDQYRTIPFPFDDLSPPEFALDINWTRSGLLGYISSWSAVALYKKAQRRDPLPLLEQRLSDVWPADLDRIKFSWPLSLRVGTKL